MAFAMTASSPYFALHSKHPARHFGVLFKRLKREAMESSPLILALLSHACPIAGPALSLGSGRE